MLKIKSFKKEKNKKERQEQKYIISNRNFRQIASAPDAG